MSACYLGWLKNSLRKGRCMTYSIVRRNASAVLKTFGSQKNILVTYWNLSTFLALHIHYILINYFFYNSSINTSVTSYGKTISMRQIIKKVCLILWFVILVGCSIEEPQIKSASVMSLFNQPEKFRGKTVAVRGYLMVGSLARLYFHREDALYRVTENSVLLNFSSQEFESVRKTCNAEYVRVVGVFNSNYEISQIQDIHILGMNTHSTTQCW